MKLMCDVHFWALGDDKIRDCFYCSDCNANICSECKNKPFRRCLAMVNRWFSEKLDK